MKINLNNQCVVTLTKVGADHINGINKEANRKFRVDFKTNWKEGDIYRTQLWSLMELFGSSLGLGNPVPFVDCALEIYD